MEKNSGHQRIQRLNEAKSEQSVQSVVKRIQLRLSKLAL